MLTIGELAGYAGVTTRTVRHYHQVGLLPEPERDASGYRTYDAAAVVALIRIRTLAEAGVPLSRVAELLDADESEFAAALADVDRRLRAQAREIQQHRRRIAQLADGDSLALPPEVVTYLEALREAGASTTMVDGERDGWILVAARWPERISEFMADKMARLRDHRTVRLYLLLGELVEVPPEEADAVEEERLVEIADLLVELSEGDLDEESGADPGADLNAAMNDDEYVALLDSFAGGANPLVGRLQRLIGERGWQGWSRLERSPG